MNNQCTHILNDWTGPCGREAVEGTERCDLHDGSTSDLSLQGVTPETERFSTETGSTILGPCGRKGHEIFALVGPPVNHATPGVPQVPLPSPSPKSLRAIMRSIFRDRYWDSNDKYDSGTIEEILDAIEAKLPERKHHSRKEIIDWEEIGWNAYDDAIHKVLRGDGEA